MGTMCKFSDDGYASRRSRVIRRNMRACWMSFWPKYVRVGWSRNRMSARPLVPADPIVSTYLDDVEKFRHHGCNASEERWTRLTFHLMTEALDLDESSLLRRELLRDAAGVHLTDGRHEDGVRSMRRSVWS